MIKHPLRTVKEAGDTHKILVENRSGNIETFFCKSKDEAEELYINAHQGGYEAEIQALSEAGEGIREDLFYSDLKKAFSILWKYRHIQPESNRASLRKLLNSIRIVKGWA